MQSYKYYARFVSIISGLIIIIASLDASQVVNLFPDYASQINTILVLAGILAPVIAQEKRVVRAEELVVDSMSNDDESVSVSNVNDDVDTTIDEGVDDIDDDGGC